MPELETYPEPCPEGGRRARDPEPVTQNYPQLPQQHHFTADITGVCAEPADV